MDNTLERAEHPAEMKKKKREDVDQKEPQW